MTSQQKMAELLARTGIPHKSIHCYGRQIVITCWIEDSAKRFSGVLSAFCSRVRGPIESIEENAINKNTVLLPSAHRVYRVYGTI